VGQTELTKAHNDPVRFEKNKQHIKKQHTLCIMIISYQGDFKKERKKERKKKKVRFFLNTTRTVEE